MDTNERKRKRESSETIVTYLTPNRTFERLLKENSLKDTKQVVRTKLNLPDEVSIHLAQIRGSRVIDLEDDDDFDAFCVTARMSDYVDVRVTVSSDSNSSIPTPSDSQSLSPALTSPAVSVGNRIITPGTAQKRKVAFDDAAVASSSSDSQVLPPRKRRKSISGSVSSTSQAPAPIPQPQTQQSNPQIPSTADSNPSAAHQLLESGLDVVDSAVASSSNSGQPSERPEPNGPKPNDVPPAEQNGTPEHVGPFNKVEKRKKKKGKGKKQGQSETETQKSQNLPPEMSDTPVSTKSKKFPEQLAETMNAATSSDGDGKEKPHEDTSRRSTRRKSISVTAQQSPVMEAPAPREDVVPEKPQDLAKAKRKNNTKSAAPVDDNATQTTHSGATTKSRGKSQEPTKPKKAQKKKDAKDTTKPTSSIDLDAVRADLSGIVHRNRSMPPPSSAQKTANKLISLLSLNENDSGASPSHSKSDPKRLEKAASTQHDSNLGSIDTRKRAAHTDESDSSSSDEEHVNYLPTTVLSSRKSAATTNAFSEADLEALIRGPSKRRLTLDNALLASAPAPAADVVLEEDADDIPTKRRRSTGKANWSDSDDSNSDSEQARADQAIGDGISSSETPENGLSSLPGNGTGKAPDSAQPTQAAAEAILPSPASQPITIPEDSDPIQPVVEGLRAESPIETDSVQGNGADLLSPKTRSQQPRSALPKSKFPLTRTPSIKSHTQPLSIHEQGVRESVIKMTRSRAKQSMLSQPLGSSHSFEVTADTPVQVITTMSATAVSPAGWTTLQPPPSSPSHSPSQAEIAGLDELRSSSQLRDDNGDQSVDDDGHPLFIASESQMQFPYSQWQNEEAGAADSDDEEEVEAAITVPSRRTSVTSYRRLTDIASQHTLFSPALSQPLEPDRSQKSSTDMYGTAADLYGVDSDTESDTDGESSHIPKSRRAGTKNH
ncbi:hypothetical protein VKT23_000850 [Stygiomarasmius scandens]|uniref:Nucleolar protein Dnt1-like N-terminal domain-containing protein n=1 Tax=Marasmiellus scandens TaxID=2682957 RepID=A0ABR1K5C3_9AGAR